MARGATRSRPAHRQRRRPADSTLGAEERLLSAAAEGLDCIVSAKQIREARTINRRVVFKVLEVAGRD